MKNDVKLSKYVFCKFIWSRLILSVRNNPSAPTGVLFIKK